MQILHIEQIVGGLEVGCAGTLDRLVMLRDGGAPVVLDLKTGLEKLLHCAQLAGYCHAAGRPYRRMAVYLHHTGYANGIEFKEDGDLRAFQGCLEWVLAGKAWKPTACLLKTSTPGAVVSLSGPWTATARN